MRLVECVPNFSEGRDDTIIGAIADRISGTGGSVRLLDIDSSPGANRTVITFAGEPHDIAEAAFAGIAEAGARIDMQVHRGAHPRLGATDVCPFVPLSGTTMDECAALARSVGMRVARDLNIPVYLYAHAASKPERFALPDVRRGQYEALPERFKRSGEEPDFGAAEFNARSGATIIGARPVLVAYNMSLETASVEIAARIAAEIRESGRRIRRDGGALERIPGLLRACRAVGWFLDEYGCAQVSVNLLDFRNTGMHHVFEAVRKLAREAGTDITGSELIGLVPLRAVLDAGRYYAQQSGSDVSEERALVRLAVEQLKLGQIKPFDADHKILDYNLSAVGYPLTIT